MFTGAVNESASSVCETGALHLKTLHTVLNRIRTHGLALKISKCHFGFPGLDWPLLCCPGFTLYLLPGAVNESASSVGEISVPLALTCSGGILVVRAGWCAKYPFCCCYIVYTYVFLQV
ncbi:uncharacterized protein LOC123511409 isoform X3 [Portunus trituberculatus]|uniref:uncharacterized protein LOC123511409 isoform X3 n=1 Tax=Portunus trituberculatus TaxID=210409 RepID=UPI001E1CB128|nr:uncharacterized protein LOC123511409 isoform X3 [Portunus trituberculatus]